VTWQPIETMNWQPIETAPRDDTQILLCDTEEVVILNAFISSSDGRTTYWCHNNVAYKLTTEMPLPPPPTD
jgi:hypothetical protein